MLSTTPSHLLSAAVRVNARLPIFRWDGRSKSVFYAPGHAVVVEQSIADRFTQSLSEPLPSPQEPAQLVELRTYALQALQKWEQLSQGPFEPVCLTVYLSNQCDLGCSYCYATEPIDRRKVSDQNELAILTSQPSLPVIDEEVVIAAAKVVAKNCQFLDKPFTLVLHGGGEPTLHFDLLTRIVSATQQIAKDHHIDWWSYIATHGVISEDKARWLSEHFQQVGLSCDGPADIQDFQRPKRGGKSTSEILERTAKILRESNSLEQFSVRTTLTPKLMGRQCEIVDYLFHQLGAKEFRFEPVYRANGSQQQGFQPEDADAFVEEFLIAQQHANSLGCTLDVSGVRLEEIHGPYCNTLRQVLHLTPDGQATACFLCTDSTRPDDAKLAIGRQADSTGEFLLDRTRIQQINRKATTIPRRCENCVNKYHCVRECAEVCPVLDSKGDLEHAPSFKCLVQLKLTEAWIQSTLEITNDC